MSLTTKPTIVLVHGAWHGPWCWKYQLPELEALGYEVAVADLPSTGGTAGKTQFDDAAAVRAILEPLLKDSRRVVVVAHSYGGPIGSSAIIGLSEAERAAKNVSGGVVGYIALCAYVLPGGMDQGAVIESVGGLPYVTWDSPSAGLFTPNDPRSMFFGPDVPKDREDWAVSQLRPQSTVANTGIVPPQAWQDDAHFTGRLAYVRCTGDNIVSVAEQDGMLAQAGGAEKWITRTLEGASHSPYLSMPEKVASAVDELAQVFAAAAKTQSGV